MSNETMHRIMAKFMCLKEGKAYYVIAIPYSEKLYSFPVPIDSVEDVLPAESSVLYFEKHIKNAIHNGTFIKEAA